jgi:hypothetical protein
MASVPYADGSLSSDAKNLDPIKRPNDKGHRWGILVSQEANGFGVFVGVTTAKEHKEQNYPHTVKIPRKGEDAYDDSLHTPPPSSRRPIGGLVNCSTIWGGPVPAERSFCRYSESFITTIQNKVFTAFWPSID